MNKMQKLIEEYGVTDGHAAKILGVSPGAVSDWKSGHRPIPQYIENSIDIHISIPKKQRNRIKEMTK